jgi:hypothetical protein
MLHFVIHVSTVWSTLVPFTEEKIPVAAGAPFWTLLCKKSREILGLEIPKKGEKSKGKTRV